MPKIFFSGLNASALVRTDRSKGDSKLNAIDSFIPLLCDNISDIEIGWDYFLIWRDENLYITGKFLGSNSDESEKLLKIPSETSTKCKQAIPGPENVIILTDNADIWVFNIYNNLWKKVSDFVSKSDEGELEYVVKIIQGRCTFALTNLGSAFNIPMLLNDPQSGKFIDIACGYDHTILLTDNGDVYTMGMGTRGQLGHGDLEDCDEPKQIEALAGLKAVRVAAAGWHSAVVTDQGDLYTWGWNNQGQLGQPDIENIIAVPKHVDFIFEGQEIETRVVKVECGSCFTICQIDSGNLWGCGCNKYGQLGQLKQSFSTFKQFVQLEIGHIKNEIINFKCREWGSCIFTV